MKKFLILFVCLFALVADLNAQVEIIFNKDFENHSFVLTKNKIFLFKEKGKWVSPFNITIDTVTVCRGQLGAELIASSGNRFICIFYISTLGDLISNSKFKNLVSEMTIQVLEPNYLSDEFINKYFFRILDDLFDYILNNPDEILSNKWEVYIGPDPNLA